MMGLRVAFQIGVLFSILVAIRSMEIKLTNVKCSAFDEPFADFQECRLRVLSRGQIGLNLHVRLHQLPVENVSINLDLRKKANGYHPFLYNVTTDFCGFMKNRKRQPFLDIFFNFIAKNSNINHTCPYNHDIIVKNLMLGEAHFKLLPLPSGDYLFILKVAAYNIWRAEVGAYMNVAN